MGYYVFNNKLFGRAHTVCDDKDGKLWRYGRLYWNFGGTSERKDFVNANLQWSFRHSTSPALKLTLGGEDNDFGWHIGIPFLVGLYFSFRCLPWKLHCKLWYEQRDTGVSFHDGTAWFDFNRKVHATWHSKKSKKSMGWRKRWATRWHDGTEWNLHWRDILLGKTKHTSEPESEHEAVVSMPEGDYPVTVKLSVDTWKRPRWTARSIRRAKVTPTENAIPSPGKGENSWDCGEDATYGLTCPAATVEEAVAEMRASVMRSREKYGSGENWRPERAHPMQPL